MIKKYLLLKAKHLPKITLATILSTISGTVLVFFWREILSYISAISHTMLSELLLITLVLLLILIPYAIYLKVSSAKDQRFMQTNLGVTRKQDELHEKWFNEGIEKS